MSSMAGNPPNWVYALDGLGVTGRLLFDQEALEIRVEPPGSWKALVVYRPPGGSSICLEPQTCIPDAVHHADDAASGWLEIPPGSCWLGSIVFELGAIQRHEPSIVTT